MAFCFITSIDTSPTYNVHDPLACIYCTFTSLLYWQTSKSQQWLHIKPIRHNYLYSSQPFTHCLQITIVLCSRSVVLNRGYTYHLGVRGAKVGGTKHQSLQGYTLWKFKPYFIEHSPWFSVVWRTIIHSLGLVRYTLWILHLACLHIKSAVA